ncbi:MAG: tRNA (guanosine(46)-N7)-methyltransferase TrmB [Lachnospiraceae bacterium]|nr:tRNA (guanosine(46)-N7)-methyltransferase TrmB [Lachnospiraceae bacterium]
MRLRNVKGSREAIADSEYTVSNPEEQKGRWNHIFANENPVHIEIGMGKGRFITELAVMHPEINFIGIEKYSSVLVRAVDKRKELDINNLMFVRMDAEYIENVFAENEVSKIYLNFSDPWPKDRHAKRRLTSRQFLARYDKILKRDGTIEFKTDNRDLFDFSMEEVPAAGWSVIEYTYNLHDSQMAVGNIMTEYEERFSSMGNPIHKMVIKRNEKSA